MAKHNLNPAFIDISTPGDVADALGQARADPAAVKTRVDFLEGLLKAGDEDVVQGQLFRVVISRDVETKRVDWHSVADHYAAAHSYQLLSAHTNRSYSDRIRVSALAK